MSHHKTQLAAPHPLVHIHNASLRLGERTLWDRLSIELSGGSFLAILGPNGAGKSSLLKVLLGLQTLSSGSVTVAGRAASRGNPAIGYIPQQKGFDASLPIRGRDLVELGLTGHRFGVSRSTTSVRHSVDEAISAVGAGAFAEKPIGLLSGGEQQRLRVAQAIISKPQVLLCDEPLLSLDIASQHTITKLIDEYRRTRQAAVLFVTHEINPILGMVDKILYIAGGKWVLDSPNNVLNAATLSRLYGTPIEVLRIQGRVIVVGTEAHGEHMVDNYEAGHHA